LCLRGRAFLILSFTLGTHHTLINFLVFVGGQSFIIYFIHDDPGISNNFPVSCRAPLARNVLAAHV